MYKHKISGLRSVQALCVFARVRYMPLVKRQIQCNLVYPCKVMIAFRFRVEEMLDEYPIHTN